MLRSIEASSKQLGSRLHLQIHLYLYIAQLKAIDVTLEDLSAGGSNDGIGSKVVFVQF